MKRGFLAASILAGVLSVGFMVMAGERAMATSETNSALDIIASGVDWDESTPISAEQQADRMEANVEVLRSQKSARNTWGGLGVFTGLIAAGSVFMMRKQDLEPEHDPSNLGE